MVDINQDVFNSMRFHAYANELNTKAYNMLLEYIDKDVLDKNEEFTHVYIMILISLDSFKTALETAKKTNTRLAKQYNEVVRDLFQEIMNNL